MDWLIPRNEMSSLLGSGRMSVLRRAATDDAYSMETCRSKFICNPPTLVQGEIIEFMCSFPPICVLEIMIFVKKLT